MSVAQEAVDVGDDGKPSHHVAYAGLVLAQAHLLTGKPVRGLGLLERVSGGPDQPLVAESQRAYLLVLLTRCRLALGEREAAARAVTLADASASRLGLPLPRAWTDRAAAAVAFDAGDFGAAADLALRSAEVADPPAVQERRHNDSALSCPKRTPEAGVRPMQKLKWRGRGRCKASGLRRS